MRWGRGALSLWGQWLPPNRSGVGPDPPREHEGSLHVRHHPATASHPNPGFSSLGLSLPSPAPPHTHNVSIRRKKELEMPESILRQLLTPTPTTGRRGRNTQRSLCLPGPHLGLCPLDTSGRSQRPGSQVMGLTSKRENYLTVGWTPSGQLSCHLELPAWYLILQSIH